MAKLASIDNCSNCTYWTRAGGKQHGVCHIVSDPKQFKNRIAFITLDVGPGAGEPVEGEAVGVKTHGDFHCTLYKVK
jgi:hypothetical protein